MIGDATVLDSDGRALRLGALLEGPTLVIFLRHWGCVECSLLLTALGPRLEEIASLGVRVVMVGLGSVAGITKFTARYRLSGSQVIVVTDPTLRAHEAAGLKKSLWGVGGPQANWTIASNWLQGHPNSLGDGDIWQLGGAVLLDRGGAEVWRHDNARLGDLAPHIRIVDEVLRMRALEARWTT